MCTGICSDSRRFFGKGEGIQREGRLKKPFICVLFLGAEMRGISHLHFYYSTQKYRLQCKIVI